MMMARQDGIWGSGPSISSGAVRAGHSAEVTFEQRPQWTDEPCKDLENEYANLSVAKTLVSKFVKDLS